MKPQRLRFLRQIATALAKVLIARRAILIARSFAPCPADLLKSGSRLSGSATFSGEERIKRAFVAGQWASATCLGRVSSPNRTPTLDLGNRFYCVLRAQGQDCERVFTSSREYFNLLETCRSLSPSATHSHPKQKLKHTLQGPKGPTPLRSDGAGSCNFGFSRRGRRGDFLLPPGYQSAEFWGANSGPTADCLHGGDKEGERSFASPASGKYKWGHTGPWEPGPEDLLGPSIQLDDMSTMILEGNGTQASSMAPTGETCSVRLVDFSSQVAPFLVPISNLAELSGEVLFFMEDVNIVPACAELLVEAQQWVRDPQAGDRVAYYSAESRWKSKWRQSLRE